MSLGTEHVEPPERAHLIALFFTDWLVLRERDLIGGVVLFGSRFESASQCFAVREALGVATENDVDTTTGHVRRDGHRVKCTRLGDDLRFTEVLLGVQHFVRNAGFGEFARQQFGLLN